MPKDTYWRFEIDADLLLTTNWSLQKLQIVLHQSLDTQNKDYKRGALRSDKLAHWSMK